MNADTVTSLAKAIAEEFELDEAAVVEFALEQTKLKETGSDLAAELSELSVPQLKKKAKEAGKKGYSGLNKDALVLLLTTVPEDDSDSESGTDGSASGSATATESESGSDSSESGSDEPEEEQPKFQLTETDVARLARKTKLELNQAADKYIPGHGEYKSKEDIINALMEAVNAITADEALKWTAPIKTAGARSNSELRDMAEQVGMEDASTLKRPQLKKYLLEKAGVETKSSKSSGKSSSGSTSSSDSEKAKGKAKATDPKPTKAKAGAAKAKAGAAKAKAAPAGAEKKTGKKTAKSSGSGSGSGSETVSKEELVQPKDGGAPVAVLRKKAVQLGMKGDVAHAKRDQVVAFLKTKL